jgi:hypothetical protein
VTPVEPTGHGQEPAERIEFRYSYRVDEGLPHQLAVEFNRRTRRSFLIWAAILWLWPAGVLTTLRADPIVPLVLLAGVPIFYVVASIVAVRIHERGQREMLPVGGTVRTGFGDATFAIQYPDGVTSQTSYSRCRSLDRRRGFVALRGEASLTILPAELFPEVECGRGRFS